MTQLESPTLSISAKKLKCEEIISFMKLVKIPCHITKNTTLTQKMEIEEGCQILIQQVDKQILEENIWYPLMKKYKLKCAHLSIPGKYSGCIYGFINFKGCPPP